MKRTFAFIISLALSCALLCACADHSSHGEKRALQATEKSDAVLSGSASALTEAVVTQTEPGTQTGTTGAQSIIGTWIAQKDEAIRSKMIFTEDGQMTNEDCFGGTYTVSGDVVSIVMGSEISGWSTELTLDGDLLYAEDTSQYAKDTGTKTVTKIRRTARQADGIIGTWEIEGYAKDDSVRAEYEFFADGSVIFTARTVTAYEDLGDGHIKTETGEFYCSVDGDTLFLFAQDGSKLAELTRERQIP